MARGALLSRHRRVVDASLAQFLEYQVTRIRNAMERDTDHFEDVLDAVDTSRGPVVPRDEMLVEVRR